MAKKAVESLDDLSARVSSEVEAEYGAGVLVAGDQVAAERREVLAVTPSVDIIVSGGIQGGSWVGLTGPPKSGKTTLALCIAAAGQRAGRRVYYSKVEGRLSAHHLRGIEGLDLGPGRFYVIQSREGHILSAQEHLRILDKVIRSVPRAVVILDSISALCDEREMDGGVGTETRGNGAKLLSQFLRMMNNVVPVNDTVVVGVTHLICNTGRMGPMYVERAARAWQYQCDYQLRAVSKTAWKVQNRQVGLVVKWACQTSPLGPPGMQMDAYLRFGVGYDALYELLLLGTQLGLVRKSGAWFHLEYLARPGGQAPKGQGAEGGYRLLRENPAWADALRARVVGLAADLAGAADAAGDGE